MKIWDQRSAYINEQDQQFIRELVDLLPKDRIVHIVDLGVGHGTTALTVFYRRSKDIAITSYDISLVNLDLAEANMIQYGFSSLWEGFCSRSDKPYVFPTSGVDLLLCDATHDYASQMDELLVWLPHCNENTYIWVHDYGDNPYPGVKTAVDELVAAGKLIQIKVGAQCWVGKVGNASK